LCSDSQLSVICVTGSVSRQGRGKRDDLRLGTTSTVEPARRLLQLSPGIANRSECNQAPRMLRGCRHAFRIERAADGIDSTKQKFVPLLSAIVRVHCRVACCVLREKERSFGRVGFVGSARRHTHGPRLCNPDGVSGVLVPLAIAEWRRPMRSLSANHSDWLRLDAKLGECHCRRR
jgi:hypothetical protein